MKSTSERKSHIWPWLLLATLALLPGLLLVAEQRLQEQGFGTRLSWLDPDRGFPLFVPQTILDHEHVDALPIRENSTLAFRLRVQRQPELYESQFHSGSIPKCWSADEMPEQGSDPRATDLLSLVEKSSEVLVGTVVEAVPGWDFRRKNVGRLLVVRISHRLQERNGIPPGEEVFFLVRGGRITVDGTELCDEPVPGLFQPQVGDSVLLSGYRYPSNLSYFEGRVFPVEDGKVLPQPYSALVQGQEAVEVKKLAQGLIDEGLGEVALKASGPRLPEEAEDVSPEELIWSDESRSLPVFLPASLLQGSPLEQLPLPSADRWYLNDAIARTKKAGGILCEGEHKKLQQGTADVTYSIPVIVGLFDFSLVGEVTSVEVGWSPWLRKVGKLVRLRVIEIVHSKVEEPPVVGAEVALFLEGGRIEYEGVTLCTLPAPDLYRPIVGDRVLSAGFTWPDPRFFSAGATFPIEGGLIQPQPFKNLDAHAVPLLLELLKQRLHGLLGEPPAIDVDP